MKEKMGRDEVGGLLQLGLKKEKRSWAEPKEKKGRLDGLKEIERERGEGEVWV